MIGGSLVGHGHPPGSSRRSVPAKTAGAILAGMRPNIALTPPLNRCPLLAQSGHSTTESQCPLLGVKRTSRGYALMSAYDPKRTSVANAVRRWTVLSYVAVTET